MWLRIAEFSSIYTSEEKWKIQKILLPLGRRAWFLSFQGGQDSALIEVWTHCTVLMVFTGILRFVLSLVSREGKMHES